MSIPAVMKAVGLTHGGFYAHFASKEDLEACVLAQSFEEFGEALKLIALRPTADARLQAFVCGYLNRGHRDHTESGCWLAAVGPQVGSRKDDSARAFYAACREHRLRVEETLRLVEDPAANRRLVTALLGLLSGILVMARCAETIEESDRILADGRRVALERFSSKIPASV